MSQVDLESIRARAKLAYPGPWFYNSYSIIFSACCQVSGRWTPAEDGTNGCRVMRPHDDECTPVVGYVPAARGDTATVQGSLDAEFIAHTRTDVPALLGLVDELMKRITALEVGSPGPRM